MTDSKTNGPSDSEKGYGQFHRQWLEGRGAIMAVVTVVVISIGGLVEIIPMFTAAQAVPEWVTPYTPLEVAGRDIYVREGCYLCHSQWVRPMRAEVLRYGEWSRAAEYSYDRPFQFGSRRLGPDLHRVGGKYPDAWHFEHMRDPRSTSPGSVMPPYPWLLRDRVDPEDIRASVRALRTVGTPYTDDEVATVPSSLEAQGREVVARLAATGIETEWDREIVAMIAYLQRLGIDGRAAISSGATGGRP